MHRQLLRDTAARKQPSPEHHVVAMNLKRRGCLLEAGSIPPPDLPAEPLGSLHLQVSSGSLDHLRFWCRNGMTQSKWGPGHPLKDVP